METTMKENLASTPTKPQAQGPRAKCVSIFYMGVVCFFLAIGLVNLNAHSTGFYSYSSGMDNYPPDYFGYTIRTMNFASSHSPDSKEQVTLSDLGTSLSKDKPYLYQSIVEVEGGRILSHNFYFVRKMKEGK